MLPTSLERFESLAPLRLDDVAELPAGAELCLGMLVKRLAEEPVMFRVKYLHRAVTLSTAEGQAGVAVGSASLVESDVLRDVSIEFYALDSTATMQGLAIEGDVRVIELS